LIKFFISAIEPSGDVLGAELIKSLKELHPESEFYGLGGPCMSQEGLRSYFPVQDLALMGFVEVLPKLPQVLKRIRQTAHYIQEIQPNVVITIDGLSFHKQVIKKIQHLRRQATFIQYVAPAVWAWKPSRAKKIASLFDKLLVIFPFEPPYFERHGLSTTFIGHPVITRIKFATPDFKDYSQIVLLPGSRHQEVKEHLPIFLQAAQILHQRLPDCRFILPTIPDLVALVQEQTQKLSIPITIVTNMEQKYSYFQNSDFAIAASGSVSLELAVARLPMVIAYKVSRFTYEIAKRLARVRYICMVNILLDRLVIPELIQKHCHPQLIANTVFEILTNSSKLSFLKTNYDEVITKLSAPSHKNPSLYAAEIIYNCFKTKFVNSCF
jgi:lipid-A-disaccharide synthase